MLRIEPFLAKQKRLGDFDCGHPSLNNYLVYQAFASTRAGYGRTYLAFEDERLVGYYTLSSASVKLADHPAPEKGMPDDLSVIRLGRLAIQSELQGQGIGTQLLLHSFRQAVAVAGLIGITLFEVHARNEAARNFYLKYGFQRLTDDELHLYLHIEAVRKLVNRSS